MGRYDKYKKAIREEIAFNEEQDRLHDKYTDVKEEVLIKETSNMGKFLLNFFRICIRTVTGIVFILLAAAGLITLIYPETREALLAVLSEIIEEIKILT